MAELRSAIDKAHDSATGPDNIYQMLKNVREMALDTLLRVSDDSLLTGNFLSAWSEATVIISNIIVAFARIVAQLSDPPIRLIINFHKAFFCLEGSNMLRRFSLTWRRPTTPH